VLILVSGLGLTAWLYLLQPVWLFHRCDFRVGNQIVSRVEVFRTTHGHLPETLDEIGFGDPDLGLYYHKVDEQSYWVWFGTSLGKSELYESQTKSWRAAR